MESSRKKAILIFSALVFIIAVAIGGWFFYSRLLAVNYLIPGVPYNGVYNLFPQRAFFATDVSSVSDILGYWGDKRFSIEDLKAKLPSTATGTSSASMQIETLKSGIEYFFNVNGYETSGWINANSDDVIGKIGQFVNSVKKVPVIALPVRNIDAENDISWGSAQVVIGVFNNSQKIIVHDHYYGNNYELSFADFRQMFKSPEAGIFAAWPSESIKGIIDGPNYSLTYPQRLQNMDKTGNLLVTKNVVAALLSKGVLRKESFLAWGKFINDPDFKYLPPAVQVIKLRDFASLYIKIFQYNNAINIINEKALPINKNLNQASEGWSVPPFDELSSPYYVLSLAYLKQGKQDLAIKSYQKMKEIYAVNKEKAAAANYSIGAPKTIKALETAISSKKH